MPLPAWLNPSAWGRALKLAANLELSEKLSNALREIDRLRAEVERIAKERTEALEKVDSLTAVLSRDLEYEQTGNALWKGSGRDVNDGPICGVCMQKDNREVFMFRYSNGNAVCQQCKTTFPYAAPQPTVVRYRRSSWVDGWRNPY